MLKRIVVLLFFVQVSFGQEYGNDIDTMKLCSSLQANNFGADAEAERGLEKILSVIGASKRFVLQPCDNINNAVATAYKGIRYILYDRQFMNSISNGNNWVNLFILAHEVGHHINGHSLDLVLYMAEVVEPSTLALKRQQELEADEFAGFVLSKLGGSLKDARTAIINASSTGDDSYSTHPSRDKRLVAMEKGFNKASVKESVAYEPTKLQTAEEYFYDGINKSNLKDYYGAIAAYSKALELNPNLTNSYYNRGVAKGNLKDYYGAIADYTKAIELNPNKTLAYINRAAGKLSLGDNYGAIADSEKAIELNPNEPSAYFNRASAKQDLGDNYGAISDLNKAIELKPKPIYYNYRGTVKADLGDRYGAIADYTKAIELNPNDSMAYWNRCLAKFRLGDNNGACRDAHYALKLGNNAATRFINNECN